MINESDIKWAFSYWCKRYKHNVKKYGPNAPATMYAYGNAIALCFTLYGQEKAYASPKAKFVSKYIGRGKLFKNTWLGKLLGLKDK